MLLLSVFILLLVRHVLAARVHPLIIITGILAGRGGEACLFFFVYVIVFVFVLSLVCFTTFAF